MRARAKACCEYCRINEEDAFFPHEPDHVIAVKHGGTTDSANLALACFECNRHKGSDLASIDPESGLIVALFNPRTDVWDDHFEARGGRIVPRTNVGRVTVTLLRMNAAARVEVREELAAQKRWPAPVAEDARESGQ
ncbi:MAG: HNH endonuclease signature motif containing protein [Polyangiales bacterium]